MNKDFFNNPVPLTCLIVIVLIALQLNSRIALSLNIEEPVKFKSDVDIEDEEPIAKLDLDDGLYELSGMANALRPNQFWGVNDKNNPPELYRFDNQGVTLQQIAFPGLPINDDWEAMAKARNGDLYIGGVGDNDHERAVYSIYRMPEPTPRQHEITRLQQFEFRYSDDKPHNCEAIFIFNNSLYLITKEERDPDDPYLPKVFRLNALNPTQINVAEEVGEFHEQATITDAAFSHRYNLLVVLSYSQLFLIRLEKESDILSVPDLSLEIDFDQCESISITDSDIIIGNEDGELWQFPLTRFIGEK